jgi:hypothetical protein
MFFASFAWENRATQGRERKDPRTKANSFHLTIFDADHVKKKRLLEEEHSSIIPKSLPLSTQ